MNKSLLETSYKYHLIQQAKAISIDLTLER